MKYFITELAPAVWGNGGSPLFSDKQTEVSETEFWTALQDYVNRKQEIKAYLTSNPDHFVQAGNVRYSIQ